MDERKSLLRSVRDEYLAPSGWDVPVFLVAIVVWFAFGPFGSLWLFLLGCAMALTAANGVSRLLVRRWRRTHRGAVRTPPPGGHVAALLRIDPQSWLLAPRWAKARTAAAVFLLFAILSAVLRWNAGHEYELLANLRHHGRQTDAIIVKISNRSEEGSIIGVTVRFDASTGPVQTDVDIPGSSTTDPKPGTYIPVVFNPEHPTQVRHTAYLDGRDAAGIRTGSIVSGLLAAGFLVATVSVVVRTARQPETATATMPDTSSPGT